MTTSAKPPLEGIRVLEFCHVASGPYAGMLLADLGADVVKVESPSGDQMRAWPPLTEDAAGNVFSHNFASVNRNKRSLVADLKDPGDLRLVLALCAEADVVLENMRPGAMDRLGLGFEAVSAGHRGLVYCSISGYGRTSPYVTRGAYDVVIQAMAGLMSVTGEPGRDPVKCGVPVGDFVAGLYAAYAVAAMLPETRRTGVSSFLDCPMLDCLVATSALQTSEYWGSGQEPQALGSRHPRNAPYQAFSSSDRPFVLAAGNDRLWAQVCHLVDRPDLATDPRFVDQSSRAANQQELEAILQPVFATKPAEHWLGELARLGVPCGPVNTFGQMLSDEHALATGLVRTLDVPVAGPTPTVVFPVRISGLPSRLDLSPPMLGEHTDEVRASWGVA